MVFRMATDPSEAAPRSTRPDARPGRRHRALGAAAVVFGLLAALLAVAPPASAATVHRTALEIRVGRAVEHVLNLERQAHGLPPVIFDQQLRLAARWHNLDMARFNTMSHQLPGESFFATRISRAGYRWTYAGENIGWNSAMSESGVIALEKIMYNEHAPNDGHRLNILSRHYRNVGIDVYFDRAHHKVWLTTDFGRK
jgi:uncharacterized protein YkwD